jgi:hypothetical protein
MKKKPELSDICINAAGKLSLRGEVLTGLRYVRKYLNLCWTNY